MKLSESWLREWVNPDANSQQLTERLTMGGLEVDELLPAAGDFSGVVVGRIMTTEPHPEADKLTLCQVDLGDGKPVLIVCGAKNVRANLNVPVATIGAVLPGNFKIKKAKLRGVESHGMICAANELGLEEKSEGIMELPEDAPVGKDFRDYLNCDDYIIDIDLTPNRGDCASVLGVAREVSALFATDTMPEAPVIVNKMTSDATLDVQVTARDVCPRYLGRLIEDIDMQTVTPMWMQERLRRSGLRPISPVVDVTNYVLLELGQPMHAFDAERIKGSLQIRMAEKGEKIVTLDGQDLTLDAETLVIADDEGPTALAGIMGGSRSSVHDQTRSIFLESAFFEPIGVAAKSRELGLPTDSAFRFARGVDPQLSPLALERATELLLSIVGGKAGPVVEVKNDDAMPTRPLIPLHIERVNSYLGMAIDEKEITEYLTRLGLKIYQQGERLEAQVPSHRFDLSIEADLIEEVARLVGYNNLPTHMPNAPLDFQANKAQMRSMAHYNKILVERGYHEAITYSFVDPEVQQRLSGDKSQTKLLNPIASELSAMRDSLWPGLLKVAAYNHSRQQLRVRLFEYGVCFLDDEREEGRIGGIASGDLYPPQWGTPARPVDFFDVKADVQALLTRCGKIENVQFKPAVHPALHPGQSAQIVDGDRVVGWLGTLHPQHVDALDLKQNVVCFELNAAWLCEETTPHFKPLSKYPAVRRDLSFFIAKDVSSHSIQATIGESVGELLQAVTVFDVYTGSSVPPDEKSITVAITLRHAEQTLTDETVDAVMEKVVKGLKQQFAITMRE